MPRSIVRFLRRSLAIVGLTVMAIEIAGLVIGNNGYFWTARQLYLSTGALRPIGMDGLWTYAPNSDIVSAATYRLSAIEGWVEYHCHFKTNRFGLIDSNYDGEYHRAVDYVILGDSFLEGQGGCPWITRASLPEHFPIVINAGLQGASIRTMELLENWLNEDVAIRNIAILMISNDFKRLPIPGIWRNRHGCLVEGNCEPRLDYVWSIAADVTDQALVELSRHIANQSNAGFWAQVAATLGYHSLSFSLIQRYAAAFSSADPITSKSDELAFSINFAALRRLHEKYPELKIVLVPQRDEVGLLGSENGDTARVKKFLSEQRIAYQLCLLSLADYMPSDGHPNRAGYHKLRMCLDRALH
jgi:hypothetical protein